MFSYIYFFHLFVVCVLYTQGVGNKEWREVRIGILKIWFLCCKTWYKLQCNQDDTFLFLVILSHFQPKD